MSKSPRIHAPTRASPREECSYFPNDNRAEAIVKAWSDASFMNNLLTFGEHKTAVWTDYSKEDQDSMLLRTSRALEEVDIFLDKPVVLTVDQFATFQKRPGEVI